MLRFLLKKQLMEVFRSYFYDAKKNRMRSKGAIAAWFVFFVLILCGMLGGIFTALSLSLCGGLAEVGMGWLYFVILGGIAIVLGAFGSVFNTYSGLYLAKDNDLLLSLPIPVRTIMTARLLNVYLLGAMYSSIVLIPALIVYWVTVRAGAAQVLCGILLLLIVTVIVLLLSCVLGWVIAKISLRLKNKSFITVLISLVFIGAYYLFYFRANELIRRLLLNAAAYGEKIRGTAYGLYLFGRIGEGDPAAAALFAAVTAGLFALVWHVMTRSFLRVVTSEGHLARKRRAEKVAAPKSPFRALLDKELARFTSSSAYMLNCGLGVLLLPASGILLLIMGGEIFGVLGEVFASMPGIAPVLLCTMLCMVAAMNDMAVPSVSLEGRSLWIPQSMPVAPKTVLRAKLSVQLLLTGLPTLFAGVCAAVIADVSPVLKVLIVAMPAAFAAFMAMAGMILSVRMPLLSWTSELAPIKQSGAVLIALFGGWAVSIALAGVYFLAGYRLGAEAYLGLWTAVLGAASLLMLRGLDTKGAEAFASL